MPIEQYLFGYSPRAPSLLPTRWRYPMDVSFTQQIIFKPNKPPSLRGKDATFIKLVSKDDYEFVIKRDYATISTTIKEMFTAPGGDFKGIEINEFHIPDYSSQTLMRVCQYMQYKVRYTNVTEMPEFDIEQEMALDLLMAANFLNC